MPDGTEQIEEFFDKAMKALNDLLEVKVVTVVGRVPITIVTKGDSTETKLGEGDLAVDAKSIVTIVKLVDGDVTTVIAEELISNTDLRALHDAQVAASLQVLPANLKALVEVGKSLLGHYRPAG